MDKELLAFVAAAGGWIVALATLLIGYRERQADREEQRLGKTLDYFDGGSQKRSIGISLLEGVWLKNPIPLGAVRSAGSKPSFTFYQSTDSARCATGVA